MINGEWDFGWSKDERLVGFAQLKWSLTGENSAGNTNLFLEPLEKLSPAEFQRLYENAWWSKRFTYYSWVEPKVVDTPPYSI